jgi:hypothetical protein
MKPILKFAACILLITTATLISCSKNNPVNNTSYNNPPPPSLPPVTDSLTGREFIFSDLIWDYDNDGAGNLYVGIENRPDLFRADRAVEVSVRSDINNTWVGAEKFHYPNAPGYVYSIYLGSLIVFPSPHIFFWSGTQLAGTKVSLKVKFL